MKVMKFGGSVLHHEVGFMAMLDIVKKQSEQTIVIISAFSDVTRKLDSILEYVKQGNLQHAYELADSILSYHRLLAETLLKDSTSYDEVVNETEHMLKRLIRGFFLTREVTSRARDLFLSRGEILAIQFITSYLQSHDVKVAVLNACDIMITDDNHGLAKPQEDFIRQSIHGLLEPLLSSHDLIVMAGFIGKSIQGEITTMGYESSNLTASLIGSMVHANEIMIWTDVAGIRSADPKYVPNSRLISSIHYEHAQSFADKGLKIIHRWMIELPMKHAIPVSIRNAFDDMGEFTIINNNHHTSIPSILIIHSQYPQHERVNKSTNTVHVTFILANYSSLISVYSLISHHAKNNNIRIDTTSKNNIYDMFIDDDIAQIVIQELHTIIEKEHETSP